MIEKLAERLTPEHGDIIPPGSKTAGAYNFTVDPLEGLPGFSLLGRMPWKASRDVQSSILSIGFETLDRDTFDPHMVFPILKDSGVKYARCQTGWMKTEKTPGVYEFGWLDDVVDGLADIGIQAWLSLSYGNPLYTPCEKFAEAWKHADGKLVPGWARGYVGEMPYYHGEDAMAAWLRYVRAIVTHFKGRVRDWEVWNEPEWFWCRNGEKMIQTRGVAGAAKDYVEFVRATGAAVREVDAEARIVANVAQSSTAYVQELGKNGIGNIIDVFSFHFYGATPEDFIRQRYDFLRTNLTVPGRELEIWEGESGRASGKSMLFAMPTEYNQAKFLLRRYMTDKLCGASLSSFFTVTDFMCYYADGSDQYYGVINAREKRPKMAFRALQALGWLFDGLEVAPDLYVSLAPRHQQCFCSSLPYNIMAGAFRRKGVPMFALWIPEHVDISAQPVEGTLNMIADLAVPLREPVAIDPLRGQVWRVDSVHDELYHSVIGARAIDQFRVCDYPLFISDASLFAELLD